MPLVTNSTIETFVKAYLDKFKAFTVNLSYGQKSLFLPKYLTENCKIVITISKIKGVSIQFRVVPENQSFKFCETSKTIEDEVLPVISSEGKVFFVLDAENQVLENLNLISKDFYDQYTDIVEKLTRATNIIMDGAEKFVDVISGDIRIIDCTLAFLKKNKSVIEKLDCLWIFSSNNSNDFSKSKAESIAIQEYAKFTSILTNRIPIQRLIETLDEYDKLIKNPKTEEPDMQTFFEKDSTLLRIDTLRIYPKFNMGGDKIPDLVLETSDYRHILVELESPNVELYTSENPPHPARKLREAESQIKSYMSYARNNILFLRKKLPLLSEERIKGLIIIGRSSRLTAKQKERLDQDRAYSKDYDIVTYDELYQNLRVFLENIGFKYSHS